MKNIAMLFAVIAAAAFISCGRNTPKNNKDAVQLEQDSLALVRSLNERAAANGNGAGYVPAEVVEFNNMTCRLVLLLPDGCSIEMAESFGKEKCMETVDWLTENGYELGTNGVMVTCSVRGPGEEGVFGEENMLDRWGRATYDYDTEMVNWVPGTE